MTRIEFDREDLKPLIEMVVEEVLLRMDGLFGERLAFTERQAAKLVSMSHTKLAEERKASRISFVRSGKAGIRYSRKHILDYLARNSETGS